MKLNKIKGICKKRNIVRLYNRADGSQLISDGLGFWPVNEELVLNEAALQTIFEVADKPWHESWIHETINVEENPLRHVLDPVWEPSAEVQFEPLPGVFVYQGVGVRALRADDGETIYVPEAQLCSINEDAQYYMLRKDGDEKLLAVYDSLLMCGLVVVFDRGISDMLRAHLLDWAK